MVTSKEFDRLLLAYPPDIQNLAGATHDLIAATLPKIEVTVDKSANVVGFGFGPGYTGMICTIILSRKAVKIGIVRGAELEDPNALLQGSGKVHRYVELTALSDLKKPGLRPLLKSALASWKQRSKAASKPRK
jgi:hypothetical protein